MSARKRLAQRALFAAVLASFVTLALGALKPEELDFICFWNGARSVEQGLDPYDEAIWSPAIAALYEAPPGTVKTPPCPGRYAYPLWTAMAMVPFGLLPLVAASVAWMVLLLAGTGAGIALLARAARLERDDAVLFATIVLSSEPAWLTVRSAQFGGLELAALGLLALPATAAQPVRLTVASFLLLLKPHLTPLIVLERLRAASGRARAIAAGALAAIVAGSLLVRPAWPAEWLGEVGGHRMVMASTSATPWGFVSWLTGRSDIAFVTVAIALVLFALALRGAELRDPLDRIAVALVGWLLVLPYLSSADPILLAVAWCAILRRARSVMLVVGLIAVATVMPWALYALKEPVVVDVRNGLVIPATAALLAYALRQRAAARPSPAAR
ncbi:MAG TPA: glycosyltransferase 87 family protein [Candidatus Limnocylindria bacterium]